MSPPEQHSGARWGQRLFSALILVLVALCGALFGALVSVVDLFEPTAIGELDFTLFFFGQLLTAAVALVLAVALAVRGGRRGYSRALALSLVCTTVAVLAVLAIPAVVDPGDGLLDRVLAQAWVVVPAAVMVAVGAFLRFAVLFPRPLTPDEIARVKEVTPEDSVQRLDRFFNRIGARFLGRSTAGRDDTEGESAESNPSGMVDGLIRLLPAPLRRIAQTPVVVDGGRMVTEPKMLWGWVGGLAAAPYVLWLVHQLLQSSVGEHVIGDMVLVAFVGVLFLIALAPLGALFLGITLLRLGYALADDADRRRMRWIVESFNAFVWGAFALAPFFVLGELGIQSELIDLSVSFIFGILPLIVVSGLAVAVFYDGALEPRLVVRKSTLYGLFGFALAFLFAITEELVTNHMTAQLGLPNGTGTLVASGVIAVVFGVFHGRFNRKVQGWLEEDGEGK